eukprot:CAMPEP_0177307918 /NCGR_PEP_ID=MMETSP0368-20130122/8499_1 /TAXON_ID=447022 ORGANISM="Scrippsiella hangoei-like, Strain SHHI-4" /NCGR_SAMPLE_ID=MMETSP0368 /ASSEMBLY_ACC=CAM_ASM_000363 /LENGTH=317 /DNA_ID=CAMNT_0018766717 /DNA_START=54 /DNA_END=1003 /DNA_ORIENTATION=-
MLHVVYASDAAQAEGVQASVASVVSSTATPDELTVHIIVQKQSAPHFKALFGVREDCNGIVTVTGVLIRIHTIDGALIERSKAKVSSSIKKERGAIDTTENFARFYMDLFLDRAVVVYLDADTIVQADLGRLRRELLASGKTIGFVARESPVKMDKFLRMPKNCKDFDPKWKQWKQLMKQNAYNVGVFAVNLQRWKDMHVVMKVEEFVAKHNSCGGKLWVGGSQPPLLLAFLSIPPGGEKDYIVFDAAWNAGDLGWRKNMGLTKLKSKFVLHWNGAQKPWNPDGLYKELWLQHRQAFPALLKPYGGGGVGAEVTAPG